MFKKLLKDEFLKNNLIFFIGSMIVAVLNYLYHPVLSRLMSVQDFGELEVLVAIFTQLGIIFHIFHVLIISAAANSESSADRKRIICDLEKIALYITGVIFLLLIGFSSGLKQIFHFSSVYPFFGLALLVFFGIFSAFKNAFLQGVKDFKSASLTGIIYAFFRIVFAAALVILGLRAFGAIAGLVIAQALSLTYAVFKTKKDLGCSFKFWKKVEGWKEIFKELKYGILIFFVMISSISLYTADMLFVKYFFSSYEAGLYGGVAIIARIVIFISGSVAAVLLASVRIKNPAEENRKLLFKAGALAAGLSGGALAAFFLFPNLIVKIMVGQKYLELANLLPRIGLAMFFASLVNLLFNYFIALRDFSLIAIAAVGILLIFGLAYFNHPSITAVVNNFLIASGVVLLLLSYKVIKL